MKRREMREEARGHEYVHSRRPTGRYWAQTPWRMALGRPDHVRQEGWKGLPLRKDDAGIRVNIPLPGDVTIEIDSLGRRDPAYQGGASRG